MSYDIDGFYKEVQVLFANDLLRAENEKLRAALHTQHALPSEEEIARTIYVAWREHTYQVKFPNIDHCAYASARDVLALLGKTENEK